MNKYAFDLKLDVSLRVEAKSYAEAVKILREKLNCAEANFGAWDNGDPIEGEASLNYDPPKDDIYEVNGDPACACPGCGAIEGEPEWGTVGDGFDGYCPSCADKREEQTVEPESYTDRDVLEQRVNAMLDRELPNEPENTPHAWDFATGEDYVEIEAVTADDVLYGIASIPLDTPHAETIAETICNAHNKEIGQVPTERT